MVDRVQDPVVGNRDSCRSIRGRTRPTTALVAIGDDEDSSEADTMHWVAKNSLSLWRHFVFFQYFLESNQVKILELDSDFEIPLSDLRLFS